MREGGKVAKHSKYFSEEELRCSHTGLCEMDELFLAKLDRLREAFGAPLIATSAYRHPTHPIEARKSKPGSHSSGRAIDLAVSGSEAHRLLVLAMTSGHFTGVGINQKGASRFIHLDDLTEREAVRPTVWSY